jgi:hypothetical protein
MDACRVKKDGVGELMATVTRIGSTFLRCVSNSEPPPARRHLRIMSNEAIIHAYRHLYRHSLRAIQFSKPARYTLRDRLRLAFRKGSAADYDQQKIQTTIEFLQYATKENGLEHKIVKNLLFVWWIQSNGGRAKHKPRFV